MAFKERLFIIKKMLFENNFDAIALAGIFYSWIFSFFINIRLCISAFL